MFLLFLVVCGVIALVVVKVVKPNQKAIVAATSAVLPANTTQQIGAALDQAQSAVVGAFTGGGGGGGGSGRRLVMQMLHGGRQLLPAANHTAALLMR